jgi:predicted amidohydrolase YtcJ
MRLLRCFQSESTGRDAADLVVLDRDAFECAEPEELREVRVVATMLGGRWVDNSPPWD